MKTLRFKTYASVYDKKLRFSFQIPKTISKFHLKKQFTTLNIWEKNVPIGFEVCKCR